MDVTGVLHCHSTYSYDGKLSLLELKDFYREREVSFVCMSEHTDKLTPEEAEAFVVECRELSDESFVFVPGFEVPYQEAHVLMLGCREFFGQVAADAQSLRDWASAAEFIVLAHPVRNHFKLDQELTAVIDGVEIWNQQYDGKPMARPRSGALLQALKGNRPELLATGGVDLHRSEHAGAPYTYLSVSALSESAIIAALKAGHYDFGHETYLIEATATWQPTVQERAQSLMAIAIIRLGKFVNKVLAAMGLSLPKSLKQFIRRFV